MGSVLDLYVLVAGVLLYLVLLRTLDSQKLSALSAAGIAMGGYVLLSSVTKGAILLAHGQPLSDLLTMSFVVTVVLQYVSTALVFYKVQSADGDYMVYLGWGGFGLALVFYIVPLFVRTVL